MCLGFRAASNDKWVADLEAGVVYTTKKVKTVVEWDKWDMGNLVKARSKISFFFDKIEI